jgi:DHA1 family tetracycline resistance protein-like MFS transporter
MGSLQSISSLGLVVMPLLGTAILGARPAILPPQDWRVGAPSSCARRCRRG